MDTRAKQLNFYIDTIVVVGGILKLEQYTK